MVPSGSIIVDDETSPPLNIQGCSSENWTSKGTFTYTYGTDSAGDPIGAIDTHQLGTGLGGHILFTHTETGSIPAEINTGTWTPTLPSLQYYKIKVHFPGLGAEATNVVYTINPGGGATPWKIRVNQAWNTETWATIGTFAMENGGSVVLTNQSSAVDTSGTGYADYDVAFDAIAFVPEGGTPGHADRRARHRPGRARGLEPGLRELRLRARARPATRSTPRPATSARAGRTCPPPAAACRSTSPAPTRRASPTRAVPTGRSRSTARSAGAGPSPTTCTPPPTSGTGNVTVHQEDGSTVTFNDSGGTYTPPSRATTRR